MMGPQQTWWAKLAAVTAIATTTATTAAVTAIATTANPAKKKEKKSLVGLRLAEAEEETPRKMTLAEEEEADAERARKAARKMTLAEGAAARGAWEGTKGANGEYSGVTPDKVRTETEKRKAQRGMWTGR